MNMLPLPDKAIVLVVDDTPENLSVVSGLLKDTYKVKIAPSGERALQIAHAPTPPDIILLDIMMPDMDGYEVMEKLAADPHTKGIPVIFLTARSNPEDEQHGLELGAVDYISKPFSPAIVLARIKNHLELKRSRDLLANQNAILELEVAHRTREVCMVQDVTIRAMATLAETRDNETGNHIRRTQHYIRILAEKLRSHPRFADFLTDHNIKLLYKSAPLHDIGKVGIPDSILLKPGRFEPHEMDIMKTHTRLGRDAILQAEQELGQDTDFLRFAKEIAYSHQEKWDGSGYPEGLAGDDIPISARLMAVADVYDALISRRVYKQSMTHAMATEIIVKGRGSHFDPDMVDGFIEVADQFDKIAAQYSDWEA